MLSLTDEIYQLRSRRFISAYGNSLLKYSSEPKPRVSADRDTSFRKNILLGTECLHSFLGTASSVKQTTCRKLETYVHCKLVHCDIVFFLFITFSCNDGWGDVEPLISAVTEIVTPELSAFPGSDRSLNRHSMSLPFPACSAEAPTRGFSAFVKFTYYAHEKSTVFIFSPQVSSLMVAFASEETDKKKKVMFHLF